MNDMELTSVDVRTASESLFHNTPSRTLPEQVRKNNMNYFVLPCWHKIY